MLLHAMQYNAIPLNGPASEAIINGIAMIMDMKGISDNLLNSFDKKGFTISANRARDIITEATTNINSSNVRELNKDDYKPILLHTGDNADMAKFH